MTEQSELVKLVIADQTATITLDSPHNRNALSRQLVAELMAHLTGAAATAAVRAIVLTHESSTFCSGADLREAVGDGIEPGTRSLLALLRTVVALPVPVVAVIHGHVRGGGIGVVGACDLALVQDDSTFAFSEAVLGLTPAIISLTTRSRLADRDAERMYLTGVVFDGVEAARSGLVTQAFGHDDLAAARDDLIAALAKVSPQGLRETKRLLNAGLLAQMDAEGEDLVALSARLFASEEAQEGMAAFRERRPPRWLAAQ